MVVGVDSYRGGWVAIALENGHFCDSGVFARLKDVAAGFPAAAVIAVDIPIGLPPPWPRPADVEARVFLKGQASSVFPTLPRPVYEAPTHAAAAALARELTGGVAVSQQSYALGPKILETDDLAREDDRIIEVHPEVSFRELTGRPLARKKTWAGVRARLSALEGAGVAIPAEIAGAALPPDDVLDAAVAGWSAARYERWEALPLPAGHEDRIGAIWR